MNENFECKCKFVDGKIHFSKCKLEDLQEVDEFKRYKAVNT